MYLALIYSFILTAILMAVLYHFQKTQPNDQEAHEKSYKSIVATGFFVFIVLLIGFHLLGIGEKAGETTVIGGSSKLPEYESGMIKNIHQQIHTGFPPF
jgi:preprotein translocase subunit SecG